MSDAETESERKSADLRVVHSVQPTPRNMHEAPIKIIPLLITLATTAFAMVGRVHGGAPWTRD